MRLTVLGAYFPRMSPDRLTSLIADDVKAFVDGIRELQQRGLAKSWSEDNLKARAAELPLELEASLSSTALFEVLVEDHECNFDPFSISEKETTSVAWAPAFLSMNGKERIVEKVSDIPAGTSFRVTFYIHDWPEKGILVGPTGILKLPVFAPVPERLWRLAPYALVD